MNFQYKRIFVALKLAEWKNFKDLQRKSGKMCLGCENMCVSVLKAQAIVDLFMLLGVSEVLYVIQIYPSPVETPSSKYLSGVFDGSQRVLYFTNE